LLILDNCEHVLDACAQLTDTLLKQCPNLKILATSREVLGILGEAAYPVPSLGIPDAEKLLDSYREFGSVRLFEERAQLARFDFSLTTENVSSVAQICNRLDGIPLAIELAAAKAALLAPQEIAQQLKTSFNLLTGENRTALPHNRPCVPP
jgi:predicted ATPase